MNRCSPVVVASPADHTSLTVPAADTLTPRVHHYQAYQVGTSAEASHDPSSSDPAAGPPLAGTHHQNTIPEAHTSYSDSYACSEDSKAGGCSITRGSRVYIAVSAVVDRARVREAGRWESSFRVVNPYLRARSHSGWARWRGISRIPPVRGHPLCC